MLLEKERHKWFRKLETKVDSCRTETVYFPLLKRNNLEEKKKETQIQRHILNSLSPIIPQPFDLQFAFSPFLILEAAPSIHILLQLTEIRIFPGEKKLSDNTSCIDAQPPKQRQSHHTDEKFLGRNKKIALKGETKTPPLFTYHIKTQVWDPDAAIWTWWHHC